MAAAAAASIGTRQVVAGCCTVAALQQQYSVYRKRHVHVEDGVGHMGMEAGRARLGLHVQQRPTLLPSPGAGGTHHRAGRMPFVAACLLRLPPLRGPPLPSAIFSYAILRTPRCCHAVHLRHYHIQPYYTYIHIHAAAAAALLLLLRHITHIFGKSSSKAARRASHHLPSSPHWLLFNRIHI